MALAQRFRRAARLPAAGRQQGRLRGNRRSEPCIPIRGFLTLQVIAAEPKHSSRQGKMVVAFSMWTHLDD